jgi:integrase
MPRPKKDARRYLRRRRGRPPVWVIIDGTREVSTGCGADDAGGAERALAHYLAAKFRAPGPLPPSELLVDEVMAVYLREHAAHSPSREFLRHTAVPVVKWWSGKTLDQIKGSNCREYVSWRTAQYNSRAKKQKPISVQTARHELVTLRSAINWYHREHGPLPSVPTVTLPERGGRRENYWLTKEQVAARIKAARAHPQSRHVARLLLIGVYSGTRPGAILKLKWMPSPAGGWFDLDNGVLHRRGLGARQSKKRAPPARIHARLLPHLFRWRDHDLARGIVNVIHYQGRPIKKLRRSWNSIAALAGAGGRDAPHILRHTCATWQMQGGTDLFEAAGYLGMSPETLWQHYGHHSPDFQSSAAHAMPKKQKNLNRTK